MYLRNPDAAKLATGTRAACTRTYVYTRVTLASVPQRVLQGAKTVEKSVGKFEGCVERHTTASDIVKRRERMWKSRSPGHK